MKISIKKKVDKTDLLAILLTEEDVKHLKYGNLNKYIEEATKKDFKGEKDQVSLIYANTNVKRILLIGLGKRQDINDESYRKASSIAVQKTKSLKVESFSILVEKPKETIEGILLGNYSFDKYKTDEKAKFKIKELTLISERNMQSIISKYEIISNNVNYVRNLINDSTHTVNPLTLTEEAKKLSNLGVKVKILDESQLKKLGLNLLLAVSQGSSYPPRLIILEYRGNSSKDKTAIVGKGITFDSGGLNLKPSGYLETMRGDMAGAATVMGTIKTLAELKIKKNVIGVMPLCENMVDGKAYKPGDVYKSYTGKTVEIANTDCEGRLILADALGYVSKEYKPARIIDLATLTGAVIVALGDLCAGVMGNNDELYSKLEQASKKTCERLWKLPMFSEYDDEIKSDIADIKNLGTSGNGRYAGPITGAVFLKQFVNNIKWAHLDIAGTAWLDKPRYYSPKMATGFGLRLLVQFIEDL